MPKAKCNSCGFEGSQGEFHLHLYAAHDLECPKCGSTNIDTSDLLKNIAGYKYGSNNTLVSRMRTK